LCLVLFSPLFSVIGQQLQPINIEHVSKKIKSPWVFKVMQEEPIAYVTTEEKNMLYKGFPATITTEYGYNSKNQLIKKFEWIVQESYRGRYQIVTVTQYDTLERKQSVLVYHKGKNHYPYKWMYKDPYMSGYEITKKWMLKEAYNWEYQSDTNEYRASSVRISREWRNNKSWKKESMLYRITYNQFDSLNRVAESVKKDYPHVSSYIPFLTKNEYVDGKLSRKMYYKESDYRGTRFSIKDGKVKYHKMVLQKYHRVEYSDVRYDKDGKEAYPSIRAHTDFGKNGDRKVGHGISNYKSCIDHYDTLIQKTGETYLEHICICNEKGVIYEQYGNYVKLDKRDTTQQK